MLVRTVIMHFHVTLLDEAYYFHGDATGNVNQLGVFADFAVGDLRWLRLGSFLARPRSGGEARTAAKLTSRIRTLISS